MYTAIIHTGWSTNKHKIYSDLSGFTAAICWAVPQQVCGQLTPHLPQFALDDQISSMFTWNQNTAKATTVPTQVCLQRERLFVEATSIVADFNPGRGIFQWDKGNSNSRKPVVSSHSTAHNTAATGFTIRPSVWPAELLLGMMQA